MNQCLFDTDILSEIIKAVISWSLRRLAPTSPNWVDHHSAASVAEISYGFRRIGREDRVRQFEASLTNAEVLPFDTAAARQAGLLYADLERSGRATQWA